MKTAIDTNVFSAIWTGESSSAQLADALGLARAQGELLISAPVYVELCAHPRGSPAFMNEFFEVTGVAIEFELDERVWREAGKRFARFVARRRSSKGNMRGNMPKRLLADFVIGAHALYSADRLLTLDEGRYRRDFPELKLLTIP